MYNMLTLMFLASPRVSFVTSTASSFPSLHIGDVGGIVCLQVSDGGLAHAAAAQRADRVRAQRHALPAVRVALHAARAAGPRPGAAARSLPRKHEGGGGGQYTAVGWCRRGPRSTFVTRAFPSQTFVKPVLHAASHSVTYARSGKQFSGAQMAALRALWAWRDEHARALDESTGYLMPNHMLMAVAESLPRDVQGLRAVTQPSPPFLNRNIDALHRIVLAVRRTTRIESYLRTLPSNPM